MGTSTDLSDEVVAAYNAPFPDDRHCAGARKFPMLVPTSPDDPAAAPNRAAWEVLEAWDKPLLCAFSDQDPITKGADRYFLERVPGAAGQPHPGPLGIPRQAHGPGRPHDRVGEVALDHHETAVGVVVGEEAFDERCVATLLG